MEPHGQDIFANDCDSDNFNQHFYIDGNRLIHRISGNCVVGRNRRWVSLWGCKDDPPPSEILDFDFYDAGCMLNTNSHLKQNEIRFMHIAPQAYPWECLKTAGLDAQDNMASNELEIGSSCTFSIMNPDGKCLSSEVNDDKHVAIPFFRHECSGRLDQQFCYEETFVASGEGMLVHVLTDKCLSVERDYVQHLGKTIYRGTATLISDCDPNKVDMLFDVQNFMCSMIAGDYVCSVQIKIMSDDSKDNKCLESGSRLKTVDCADLFPSLATLTSSTPATMSSCLPSPTIRLAVTNDYRCVYPDGNDDLYIGDCSGLSNLDTQFYIDGSMLVHVSDGKCLWAQSKHGMRFPTLGSCDAENEFMHFYFYPDGDCTYKEACLMQIVLRNDDSQRLELMSPDNTRLVFRGTAPPTNSPTSSPVTSPGSPQPTTFMH